MAPPTPPRAPVSVATVALASRACLIAWAALTAAALTAYDTSGTLLQPPRAGDARPLDTAVLALCGHLGNWDGAYFTHLAAGGYAVEQFHAFYPGLPGVLRAVRATLLAPLVRGGLLSAAPAVLLAGVLTSVTAFVAAAVLLEALSAAVLRDARRARLAALLWCLSPAGVFTVAVYTESLFAALTFGGLLALQSALDAAAAGRRGVVPRLFLGALACAAAAAVRSNGVLLGGFVAYYSARCWAAGHEGWSAVEAEDAATTTTKQPQGGTGGWRRSAAWRVAKHLLSWLVTLRATAVMLALVAAPHVLFSYYAYFSYCGTAPTAFHGYVHKALRGVAAVLRFTPPPLEGADPSWVAAHGGARPWCAAYNDAVAAAAASTGDVGIVTHLLRRARYLVTLPDVYGFVQATHWGVGPLRYYQAKHAPQFLLAAPVLALAASAVRATCRRPQALWAGTASVARALLLPCVRAARQRSQPRQPGGSTGDSDGAAASATTKGGSDERQLHSPSGEQGLRRRTRRAVDDTEDAAVWRQAPSPSPSPRAGGAASKAGGSSITGGTGGHPLPAADTSLLLPHAVHLALLAAVAVGVMNVQVATRLLCAGCPLLYWHAAGLWAAAEDAAAAAARKKGGVDGDDDARIARRPNRQRLDFRHAYAAWGVGYSLVGGALFALFLPWT